MDETQVLGLDYRQPLDGVPDEVLSLLPLFDGRRTVAQVIQLTRLPRPTALELVQRLRRTELLCEPEIEEDPRAPALDEWLGGPKRRKRPLVFLGAGLTPLIVVGFFLLKHKEIAPVAAAAVTPIAPPTVVAAPQPQVAVPPPVVETAKVVEAPKVVEKVVEAPKVAESPIAKPAESYESLVAQAKKHLDQGKLQKALDESRRALALNDRGADAYLVVGTIQQQNGHTVEAKAAFKKYLELSPKGQFAGEIRSILKSL